MQAFHLRLAPAQPLQRWTCQRAPPLQAQAGVMEPETQGCMICKSNPKHCFCPTCVHDKLADVRRFLRQLQLKRSSVAQQMENIVSLKVRALLLSEFRPRIPGGVKGLTCSLRYLRVSNSCSSAKSPVHYGQWLPGRRVSKLSSQMVSSSTAF